VKKSNRRVVVFATLVSVLTLTSALLLALAPAPLTPDSSSNLFAVDTPESMDVIFQTQVSTKPGRWKYIYVHHSHTASGNAVTLSQGNPNGMTDHFVIGNGDGAIDGEIQVGQRWNLQTPAEPPRGAKSITPDCISICLVGDYDRKVPSPVQIQRLTQLLHALQGRFDIPAAQVLLVNEPNSAAGIGRHFATTAFRQRLLP
jgi:hypothetical protein